MPHTSAALEARIARLESAGQRLKLALVVLPLLGIALGAAGKDALSIQSVTTERLTVVDESGKPRIALYANSKSPFIELYNPDGSLLLNLARSDDNGIGCIQFFDAVGKFKGGAGGNALK